MTDITPQFLAGERLSAAKLQQLSEFYSWTPGLTAATTPPTLGTGATQTGTVHVNGPKCTGLFSVVFGTGSSAGSGRYYIELPPELPFYASITPSEVPVGLVQLVNAGISGQPYVAIADVGNDRFLMRLGTADVTHNAPFAWGDGDGLYGQVSWLTDFGA